jgi:hypothetical protein
MELSKATLELLRDEAYVALCREAIVARLEARNREPQGTRLSRASTPAAAQSRFSEVGGLNPSDPNSDIALHSQLTRAGRFEVWLQRCIRRDLAAYLEESSATFQCYVRIQQALNEWEFCVRHVLPDSLAEFARELRGLRMSTGAPQRRGAPGPFVLDLSTLRQVAMRVEEQQLQIGRIASAIVGHAQQTGVNDVLPPPLPNFRRIVWVDWLSVVPSGHLVTEVTRIESEIRAFLNTGLMATLELLEISRAACTGRQDKILQDYWAQLRKHAQAHYVKERDLDEVLDDLAHRYDAEIARRHREVTRSPFLTET